MALNSSNELVCKEILKVVCDFLNPETCPLSDTFQKLLEIQPGKFLRFSTFEIDQQSFVN